MFLYNGEYGVVTDENNLLHMRARFYNPEIKRFVNEYPIQDGLNWYAYAGGNPMNRLDPSGESAVATWGAGMSWLPFADGPIPIGDVLYLIGFAAFAIAEAILLDDIADRSIDVVDKNIFGDCIPAPISDTKVDSIPKDIAIDIAIDDTLPRSLDDTIIYRWGGTSPSNLTPRKIDADLNSGLSFSTIPKFGAAMTTIATLNATGVVYAVKDGLTHVSVYPIGGTVRQWHEAGSNSIWTQAVKSVVVKLKVN
jgi:RHS repeat-associated protein